MITLSWGAGLAALAFLVHAAVWRAAAPKNSGVALLSVFALTFIVGWAGVWAASLALPNMAAWLPNGPLGFLHICVVYGALTSAYVMTYPAVEVESPSLVISELVAGNGDDGLSVEGLYRELNDDLLFWPRVRNLLDEKAVVLDEGRYRTTAKGAFIARLFNAYRALLGATDRGG